MNGEQERPQDSSKKPEGISDLIRGAITTGVRSVLVTEENIRGVVTDLIPKEMSAYIKMQVDSAKKEIYQAAVTQLATFLSQVDVSKEVKKVLKDMKMVVKVEIDFVDKAPQAPAGAVEASDNTDRQTTSESD